METIILEETTLLQSTEFNLPNLLPENYNTDISLFLDFGSVWGVDYDSTLDKAQLQI